MNSAINEHGWLAGVTVSYPDHLEGPALEGPPNLSDLDLLRETNGEAVKPRVDGGEVMIAQPIHVSWGARRSA